MIFASCQQNYINSGSLKKLDFMYEELLVCAQLLSVFRGGEGSGLPLGPIASEGRSVSSSVKYIDDKKVSGRPLQNF